MAEDDSKVSSKMSVNGTQICSKEMDEAESNSRSIPLEQEDPKINYTTEEYDSQISKSERNNSERSSQMEENAYQTSKNEGNDCQTIKTKGNCYQTSKDKINDYEISKDKENVCQMIKTKGNNCQVIKTKENDSQIIKTKIIDYEICTKKEGNDCPTSKPVWNDAKISKATKYPEIKIPVVQEGNPEPLMTIVLRVLYEKKKPKAKDPKQVEKERLISEMTSAWRVITFFFVVFILPTLLISIPLYARYHVYHARTLAFTDGDMPSFHKDVSTFWCQGQRLMGNGSFEAYLTKDAKRVKKIRKSFLSSEVLLTTDDVEEWGVHMIRGSRFRFSTCSRWPGGTLLVVQGEDNMRRCFYKEERVRSELNEPKNRITANLHHPKDLSFLPTITKDENKGGEVFEEDKLTDRDLIRQLYSNNKNTDVYVQSPLGSADQRKEKAEVTDIFHKSPSLSLVAETDDDIKTVDDKEPDKEMEETKNKKKKRGSKSGKKKRGRNKQRNRNKENNEEETEKKKLVKREVTMSGSDMRKLEGVLVNRGSFFFNLNDTLDVTTGNSSFSSSEEFLRQCSVTVVSIDLSPFPDCRSRVDDAQNESLTWDFRVNDTDYYYFIFTSDNSIEANIISFRLSLERRLYNVSDNIGKCTNSSECVFPLSFMKSEGVIVDYNEHYQNISKLQDLNNYQLTLICQPRSVVYTVFILLVPFIIIVFAFR